jgi:hypothetical protein
LRETRTSKSCFIRWGSKKASIFIMVYLQRGVMIFSPALYK